MTYRLLLKIAAVHILIFSACLVAFLSLAGETFNTNEKSMDLENFLPGEVDGWKKQGPAENYDRETIFKYMNGAGEVYRMYDYRSMAVSRMVKEDNPEITIEIFDMGKPEDAYGIFSHSRSSEDSTVGQGATYQPSLLCFWKNRYFVCITAMEETPETKSTLYRIASGIDELIEGEGAKPAILECLPEENIDSATIRYFHLYTSLNYHYYLADKNILNLDETTEAVLARYKPNEDILICIRYPNRTLANEAMDRFLDTYIPDVDDAGLARTEDGRYVAARLHADFILLVLDSPDRDSASGLIEAAGHRLLQLRGVEE